MKQINEEELKTIQLDILQNTANFCDRNGITYFLAYGTLIGAIRHNGYIPWDDDIDIAMPRPDYDKFIQHFNEQTSHIKVIAMENDMQYGFSFAKVHDTRTIINETQYKQDKFGVYIDIFPIDGVKGKAQVKKLRMINKLLHTKKANYCQRKLSKKIINTFGKMLLLPFSTHTMLRYIDRLARKYPFGSLPYAGGICDSVVGERAIVDVNFFKGSILHEFEGRQYKIPIGYDKWLRSIYGDYMQLPPEDKRKTHHVFEAWWKDEIDNKDLKNIQLDLLRKTADFCEKNDIRYFLCGGTLLGAIRHQGYIPWDDDIDISMPRPDYDRFISLFNNPDNYYQVIDMSNNAKYGFPFAKVHDTRTIVDELQYKKDQFGVYIDIFPIDGVGEDEQVFRILRLRKLLHTKKANNYQRKHSKKIINSLGKIILLPFSTHYILKMMDKEARKYPFGSTGRAGIIINPYGTREIMDIHIFDKAIKKKFEDREYMVPEGYDAWLRSIYKDYMQYPPIEQRKSPHVFNAYWK